MSNRGRPRIPTKLKLIKGTARKDRINAKAPRPKEISIPAPPDNLVEREKRCWRYLAKLIDPLKVVTAADMVAFEQLVLTYAIIHEAHEDLRRQPEETDDEDAPAAPSGLTYTQYTQNGPVLRRRPEVDIIKDFKKQLAVDLSRFGLTPADRERVNAVGDGAGPDPIDEFATGRRG